MSERLDKVLVERGLVPSRTKAQALIEEGQVEILTKGKWIFAHSPSQLVGDQELRVASASEVLRYVSRGGLKLEGALKRLDLSVKGWRCLDAGLSTGGFADCLLQFGASEVCGFDVGHGQLDAKLKSEPRLKWFDKVNVKDLARHKEIQAWIQGGIDLVVADLSFISLISVLPAITQAAPSSALLALVKPQFEVGPAALDKHGIADPKLFDDVKARVLLALEKCGFSVEDYFASQPKGQDGNQEFFVYASRT
jgi:23S rRNA (cytidine1920-2'-O)/16S rRNA (cytidine1409-2'-O)-methyltransferase